MSFESHPCVPQSAPGASVVATGSDDGYVGVWDSRVKDAAAGANVALLKPAHAQTGDVKEASPGGRGSKLDGAECVTCLEASCGQICRSLCCLSALCVDLLSLREVLNQSRHRLVSPAH